MPTDEEIGRAYRLRQQAAGRRNTGPKKPAHRKKLAAVLARARDAKGNRNANQP